jgi:hypothetical protein
MTQIDDNDAGLDGIDRTRHSSAGRDQALPPSPHPTPGPASFKEVIFWIALVLAVAIVVSIIALGKAMATEHRCRGLWTGNSCIGSWSNTRQEPYYEGDTYVRHGRTQQRPERR